MLNKPTCVLTIAGTDPSGGAGIQADLKTFEEFKTYGMTVVTSVVAQNTTGVRDVHHMPLGMIAEQIEAVITDIPPHALKTGMIANERMMQIIKQYIEQLNIPYVLDPVMVATSGDVLIDKNCVQFLRDSLIPLSTVVTPNIPEAEIITGRKIVSLRDMQEAAREIVHVYGATAALVKGGHMEGEAVDLLFDGGKTYHLNAERIQTTNTHGTGCTYSAAITALLAKGMTIVDATQRAKDYITSAIKNSFSLGAGNGPTNHWAMREEREGVQYDYIN